MIFMTDTNLWMRIRAGKLAVIKGLEIQETIGEELADFMRRGGNRVEALKLFEIEKRFDLTPSVALSALRSAIAGSKGRYDLNYEGLIPNEELGELDRRAMLERGNRSLDQKKGVYGLSPELMAKIHSKAGKAVRDKGKGIHGLSYEENARNKRLATIARGRTPWEDIEKSRVYMYSNDLEYQIGNHYNLRKIAEMINYTYHDGKPVRTSVSIGQLLTQHKKEMKKAR